MEFPANVLQVIHEDDELLVINKPSGLVCHPSKDGELSSLIGRVRLHLNGSGTPHLVNRIDRETSGVIMVAKTDAAARALRQLWEAHRVQKEYLAIVHGHVRDDRGTIDAALGKDVASRVVIKDCVRSDGAASQTDFEVLTRLTRPGPAGQSAPFTVLRVLPRSGRKHQIRIHLAHIGHPIVGDKIYGGDEDAYLALVEDRLTEQQRGRLMVRNHALHARALRFDWGGQPTEFCCEPEPWFTEFPAA